jgi:pimeloyl-ACP methyl ester carboxylesterase
VPVRLHVEESGPAEAPTIVFVHASGVAGWMWRQQIEVLQDEFHCLAPDLPEHGQSREAGRFSILDGARQVADLIHKRAHNGRAHVVGASLGAQVATALLGLAPGLIDRAVISSALLRPIPLARFMDLAMKLYAPFKNSERLIRANMRALEVPESYFAEFAAETRRASAESLARVFRANMQFRLPPGLSRLMTPALVLVGEREPKLMRRSGRDLVQAMPGATGRLVENMRHNWSMTAPGLFTQTLRAWITDQPLPDGLRILRGK